MSSNSVINKTDSRYAVVSFCLNNLYASRPNWTSLSPIIYRQMRYEDNRLLEVLRKLETKHSGKGYYVGKILDHPGFRYFLTVPEFADL